MAGGCGREGRDLGAELRPLDHCPSAYVFRFLSFPSIFPSPDQPANVPVLPPAMNTGGSLPDLTNLHFPPPLPTPLDPEETAYPSLSGANSTSNLTHTMTHLGISGGLGLGPGYDVPGEWLSWLESPRDGGREHLGSSRDGPYLSINCTPGVSPFIVLPVSTGRCGFFLERKWRAAPKWAGPTSPPGTV